MSNEIFDNAFTEGVAYANEESVQIDIDKATPAQIRETMLNSYEPNKLQQQQTFNAVVLKQLETVGPVGAAKLVRVKARIPEIHSLLPLPVSTKSDESGEKDYSTIAMHPTFTAPIDSLGINDAADTLKPGCHIEVTFDNMSNYASGKIVKIHSDAVGGSSSRTSTLPVNPPILAELPEVGGGNLSAVKKGIHFGPAAIVPCFQGNCMKYRLQVGHDPQPYTAANVTTINAISAPIDRWPHIGRYTSSPSAVMNVVANGGKGGMRNQGYNINGRQWSADAPLFKESAMNKRRLSGTGGGRDAPRCIILHQGGQTFLKTMAALIGRNLSTNYIITSDGTIYEVACPGEWSQFKPLYTHFGHPDIPSRFHNGIFTHHTSGNNGWSIGVDLTWNSVDTGKWAGNSGEPAGVRIPSGKLSGAIANASKVTNDGTTSYNMVQLSALSFLMGYLKDRIPTLGDKIYSSNIRLISRDSGKYGGSSNRSKRKQFIMDNKIGLISHWHLDRGRQDLLSGASGYLLGEKLADNILRLPGTPGWSKFIA